MDDAGSSDVILPRFGGVGSPPISITGRLPAPLHDGVYLYVFKRNEAIPSFDNMAIPKEQKALVIQEGQTLKVEKIPVPKLNKDDEILIKVGFPSRPKLSTDMSGRSCCTEPYRLETCSLQTLWTWKYCWMRCCWNSRRWEGPVIDWQEGAHLHERITDRRSPLAFTADTKRVLADMRSMLKLTRL